MNRAKFAANEMREEIFAAAGYRCEVCGGWLRYGQPQAAHRIAATKANLKKYGAEVIHNRLNLAATCSSACNASVLIQHKPVRMVRLLELIAEDLKRSDVYGID